MREQYEGLDVFVISLDTNSVIKGSGNCQAMIQLKLENGICISPEWQHQIEYVGDKG